MPTTAPDPPQAPLEAGDAEPCAPLRRLIARARRRALGLGAATALAVLLGVSLTLSLPVAFVLGDADLEGLNHLLWLQQGTLLALAGFALAAIAYFLVVPWRRLATDAQLALHLERGLAAGAGLASAVEFRSAQGDRGASKVDTSPALANAHIARVARRLDTAPLDEALPSHALTRAALVAALLLGGTLLSLFLPGSPVARGYHRLFALERGIGLLEPGGASNVPTLITGDISLTYLYPAYTRRKTRTVSGTGGEITALPGTEVSIRTTADRAVAQAALLVGDNLFPLKVEGERSLSGTLQVREAGSYRFRFLDARGHTVAEGAPHRIGLEPDAWPEVELDLLGRDKSEHLEIDPDEKLPLRWSVSDDFGVDEVTLVYRVRGGQEKRQVLGQLRDRRRGEGNLLWSLSTLRLSPGESVTVLLEATDNDVISGPKIGRSRSFTLEVFSRVAHRRALIEQVEQAWKAMLSHLADHLETPFEAAPEAGPEASPDLEASASRLEQMRGLSTGLNTLVGNLRELESTLRADPLGLAALGAALRNIISGLSTRARRFEIGLRNLEIRQGLALARLRPLRRLLARNQARTVRELEKDILYLEDLLDRERILALQEIAQALTDSKRRLESLVDRLKANPSEEIRSEIAEEIARLKERIFELMRRMQELAKTIRDENLNLEAMQQIQKSEDLLSRLDELQKLINEGSLDEALARLQEMGEQLDQMMQRFKSGEKNLGGEKYQALMREMNAFRDELERLRHDQEELLEESRELKDRYQKDLERRVSGKLDALAKKLQAKAEAARALLQALPASVQQRVVGRYDQETLEQAASRLEEVQMLLKAHDFDEALKVGQEALRNVSAVRGLFTEARRRDRLEPGFPSTGAGTPEAMQKALEESDQKVGASHDLTRELVEELEALFPDPREVFDARAQKRMAQMGRTQEGLRQRASKLAQQMKSIAERAPIFSPQMENTLRKAGRHMSEAAGRLAQSDARRATGQEHAALERLGDLGKQMQQAMQQQGQGGMPIPLSPGEGNNSGRFGQRREKVKIPDAAAYKAPEAFREELLKAMKEGSPERYEDQVKRYYEELVR